MRRGRMWKLGGVLVLALSVLMAMGWQQVLGDLSGCPFLAVHNFEDLNFVQVVNRRHSIVFL